MTNSSDPPTGSRCGNGIYEIRIRGHLDALWAAWFDGLKLCPKSDGTTVIYGPVADQAALHGLLRKVRDLGLPLVSVNCVIPAGAGRSGAASDGNSTGR